jgi:hypothetical protein
VKFFETGSFTVTVEDTVNSILIDTATISVYMPQVPFLSIGASAIQIAPGETTTLSWSSNNVTSLAIDNGIGAVDAAGTLDVSPTVTTTYTISGTDPDNDAVSSSVTITVAGVPVTTTATPSVTVSDPAAPSMVTPSATVNPSSTITASITPKITKTPDIGAQPTSVCPSIQDFTINASIIRKDNNFTMSWHVVNADKVSIDAFSSNLPLSGNVTIALTKSQEITLMASRQGCMRKVTQHIEVVSAYPWEGAGGMFLTVVALESIAMQTGGLQGNLWLALVGIIDRSKKRKPWGIVYDSVTKQPLSRVMVRLWDAVSGVLTETVISDANGFFKLSPREGKYILKVVHPLYSFPSQFVAGDTDTGYTNIYKGEVIEAKDGVVMVSVPLDPVKKKSGIMWSKKLFSFVEGLFSVMTPVMLVLGLVYSITVTVMYPLIANYVILALYLIAVLVKVAVYLMQPKMFGKVENVGGGVVSGLEIGLYDKEFRTLVARTFSNKQGKYNFVVSNSDYSLQLLDSSYKLLDRKQKEGALPIAKRGRSPVLLVTEDLLVYEASTKKTAKN